MPNCSPPDPISRISLSLISSFSSCTNLAMVKAPPLQNHKTRIPNLASAHKETAFRQSFKRCEPLCSALEVRRMQAAFFVLLV